MNLTVLIDGRGQSYKTNLTVDPLEKLETCLKNKTHFWRTFMMRGQHKCMVVVENKGEEPIIVAPDYFRQSFQEIGVCHTATITLYEVKNLPGYLSDGDEGGEEEHEEMEDEQVEEANGDEQPEQEEEDENKKASELLFEGEGDQKTGKHDDE